MTETASGRPWVWRAAPLPFGTAARLGVDALAARLFLARGCAEDALDGLMHPSLRAFLPDPSLFADMDKAAARLADAVEAGERIALFADYDVDGATSAAILSRTLTALGATPRHYIPDRLLEGYGPNADALLMLKEEGAALVVVLDSGTQAYEPLAAAATAGLPVIVVDHHKASPELPRCFALINPARLDESADLAAYRTLCTAGLTFLLAVALVRALRQRGFFTAARPEPRLGQLLDLVALGTVADVMLLVGLNRAFVALGLQHMAARRNIGLAALLDVAGIDRPPTAQDVGFQLGPRINAGGRVGKSDLGVRLLTTTDPAEAQALAAELDTLNEERRALEAEVTKEAFARFPEAPPHIAIAAGTGWHPGVIGIAAARVKERLQRPVILLSEGADGIAKGSGRSIDGVDLGQAVLAAKEAGLIVAGGGHAMACGVTVETARIPELERFLDQRIAPEMAAGGGPGALRIDLSVAARGFTMELAGALDVVEPCGNGWPRPRVAVGPVRLVQVRRVGRDDAPHIKIIAAGADGGRVEGIAFRAADTPLGALLLSAGDVPLWLAGRVLVNSWQGRDKVELRLDDAGYAS